MIPHTEPTPSAVSASSGPVGTPSSRNHIRNGCLIALIPIALAVLAGVLGIGAAWRESRMGADGVPALVAAPMIGMVLVFLASPLFVALAMWVGIRRTWDVSVPVDPRSGKTGTGEVPESVKGWNWGAAGLPWIWGCWHRVGLAALRFVPIVGMFWFIAMGLKGSEWAWRATPWASEEAFKKHQDAWKIPGMIFFALMVLSFVAQILAVGLFSVESLLDPASRGAMVPMDF